LKKKVIRNITINPAVEEIVAKSLSAIINKYNNKTNRDKRNIIKIGE
jgi:hypothetical protein